MKVAKSSYFFLKFSIIFMFLILFSLLTTSLSLCYLKGKIYSMEASQTL